MTGRLTSLDEALAAALTALKPVVPESVRIEEAVGLRLAADLAAALASPAEDMALRSGLAVRALDLVGASMHAPVMLADMPATVAAGDPMPQGTDAVLDPAAASAAGPFIEVSESLEPGRWVRRAGHDLAAGQTIARAGSTLTPEAALAAAASGVAHVYVLRPRVRLDWQDSPERRWMTERRAQLGAAAVNDQGRCHVVIRPLSADAPRIALMPGSAATMAFDGEALSIGIPRRFDAVVGAWCALVLPALARLLDAKIAASPRRLSRKVASAVGMSEVVLLKMRGGDAEPLACGDLTLSAIAEADAFAIAPPDLEGYPAGADLPCTPFDSPFLAEPFAP
jgi:molybdopterin biosynthesis enzyme